MNEDDLSIFEAKNDIECDGSSLYKECATIRRLLKALQYRSFYDITHNKEDEEIFINFMNTVYPYFMNEYHHFIDYHSNEVIEIYEYLISNKILSECNMEECQYSGRHHRIEVEERESMRLDAHSMFFVNVFDSLHFQLFHSVDAALRIGIKDNDDDDKEQFDEEKSVQYFDAAFARLHQKILHKTHRTASFPHFSATNSKYTISISIKDNKTYLDQVINHLMIVNVDIDDINELIGYLFSEEYDSVSMKYDEGLNECGNIAKNIKNKLCLNTYTAIIKKTKISSSSFAVGLRTYYWIYYKDKEKLSEIEEGFGSNINHHSGFMVKELYIESKYLSFKKEIINYKYIEMKQYEEEVLMKVKQLMKTKKVKKTTATRATYALHYEIEDGDPIRMEHLISLVMYTDFTNLCTDFSSSFRAKNAFETLKSVKKRNAQYYWMSRHLRECVEIYGQCSFGDKRYGVGKDVYLNGPYYTGVNVVLNIASFNIRLCSPTSTSKQISVAIKFSGTEGMVLQLNNPNTEQYHSLNLFDASWISRFTEEDERLFCGGFYFIKIESIHITATKQNFALFIHALYYLDIMITAGECDEIETTKEDVFVMKSLFENVLNKNENTKTIKSIDNYIISTFNAFRLQKTQIVLDLNELNKADNKMRDLFLCHLDRREQTEEKERDETDCNNLFKAQIFDIFSNIQNIIIQSTDYGKYSYSLSLFCLLSLIEKGSVEEVIVKAVSDCYNDYINWIEKYWISSSEILMKRFQQKNYNISMEETDDGYNKGYCFVINKR